MFLKDVDCGRMPYIRNAVKEIEGVDGVILNISTRKIIVDTKDGNVLKQVEEVIMKFAPNGKLDRWL